jgi:hypothetical protein
MKSCPETENNPAGAGVRVRNTSGRHNIFDTLSIAPTIVATARPLIKTNLRQIHGPTSISGSNLYHGVVIHVNFRGL